MRSSAITDRELREFWKLIEQYVMTPVKIDGVLYKNYSLVDVDSLRLIACRDQSIRNAMLMIKSKAKTISLTNDNVINEIIKLYNSRTIINDLGEYHGI